MSHAPQQLILTDAADETRWAREYRVWIEANPQVLDLADRLARSALRRRRRLSSGTIVELIRWTAPRAWAKDDRGFKINQNFGAYLIRDIVRRHPNLRALVEFRSLRAVTRP